MKLNKILAIAMIVGLIASGISVYQRFRVESGYKNYEVDFYYSELEKLAQQEEKTIDEYLELMKGTGVSNMFIKEETLSSMKESPNFDVETSMDGYDMIIESPDKELIQWIYKGYNEVKRNDREVVLENENTVRVLGKSYEQITAPVLTLGSYGQRNISAPVWKGSMLETVGLGYDQKAIDKAKAHGYGVVLSPTFNSDFQDGVKSVQRYFKAVDSNGIAPSHIFFSGTKVVGFDLIESKKIGGAHKLPAMMQLAEGLEDRNIAIGFIESSSQGGYLETDGMKQLAKMMEYEATGNYLTWDFIQSKYDFGIPFHHNGEEITNIFFRGITTRNIRVISLKPFVKDNRYIPYPKAYKDVLDSLQKRLKVHNIQPGTLKTMAYFEPSNMLKIIASLGITASCLIILDNLFFVKRKWLYILLSLSFVGSTGVYLKLSSLENIVSKIFALLGAMAMPTIALIVLTIGIKNIYKQREHFNKTKSFSHGVLWVVLLTILCLGGALFEMAMLASSQYLLGLDAFSGVKFSQMIPMLMAPIVYASYHGYKRGYKSTDVGITMSDVLRFFQDSIKMWQVALMGIAGAVLLVFMLRSGNTSGDPSLFEALLRNVLETVFPARPRTKAIFVGIPALLLLFYHGYQKRFEKGVWVFAFVGSIALVNTVNTFSHMKAPIYLSVYRTGAELIVGVIVGLLLIFLEEAVYKIVMLEKNKRRGKITINE